MLLMPTLMLTRKQMLKATHSKANCVEIVEETVVSL